MFETNVTLYGKHATYAKYLKDSAKIFDRLLDVYMQGAIWGLLYNRTAERDNTSGDRANILAEQIIGEKSRCSFLFTLVMLLQERVQYEPEDRVTRAFRDASLEKNDERIKENLEIFESFVRGGIEKLYESFSEGFIDREDYVRYIMDLMKQTQDDIAGASYDDKINRLLMR